MQLHRLATLPNLTLQYDDIDIMQDFKYILKSHKSLRICLLQNPAEWPVVKDSLHRLKGEHGGKVYQGLELLHFCDVTTKRCITQTSCSC